MPYELLNKKFRAAQKQLDREVSHVQAAAVEIEKGLQQEKVGAGDISKLLGIFFSFQFFKLNLFFFFAFLVISFKIKRRIQSTFGT